MKQVHFKILLHKAMKQEYFQTYRQKIEYEEPIYANPSAHSKKLRNLHLQSWLQIVHHSQFHSVPV